MHRSNDPATTRAVALRWLYSSYAERRLAARLCFVQRRAVTILNRIPGVDGPILIEYIRNVDDPERRG